MPSNAAFTAGFFVVLPIDLRISPTCSNIIVCKPSNLSFFNIKSVYSCTPLMSLNIYFICLKLSAQLTGSIRDKPALPAPSAPRLYNTVSNTFCKPSSGPLMYADVKLRAAVLN